MNSYLASVALLNHHGRYILSVLVTCSRQNGQRETADEHRRHNTCPHGTTVISISLVKHILHSHAALAVSASLVAVSDFSCKFDKIQVNR
ncbi:hypothetical protein HanPI659440_Chr12g0456971 [Helianthus annuus]|nr:hypothetical protein HanPI659440_Chr12g0456971 [Helianthus annuus]